MTLGFLQVSNCIATIKIFKVNLEMQKYTHLKLGQKEQLNTSGTLTIRFNPDFEVVMFQKTKTTIEHFYDREA
jgi:hypothetical protein